MTTAQLSAALLAKGPVTVALAKPHDPAAFYQRSPGLYVYDEYRRYIVEEAKPTQSASPITLRRFVLDRDASDEDIEAELGPNHVFTESEVCWIVAELTGKQEGGAVGDLDNTGKVNLFYTLSWVVGVRWGADGRGWRVDAWGRGGRGWRAGGSVFSRN
jgi:hypothetical protein